jgi:hypothetical protein
MMIIFNNNDDIAAPTGHVTQTQCMKDGHLNPKQSNPKLNSKPYTE